MSTRTPAAIAMVAACMACTGEPGRRPASAGAIPAPTSHENGRPEIMTIDACQAAARAIRERQFVGWRGLPGGCTPAALVPGLPDPLPELADQPARRLGSDASSAAFVVLELPGWYRPMASFRGGSVVLVDGMTPELAGGAAPLLADLGAPAAKLDWDYGTLPIAHGEWPYPERGVTLFLNTTSDKVLHMALYVPTTLEVYLRTLRPPLAKRPAPAP
jgi:hypothetical protein